MAEGKKPTYRLSIKKREPEKGQGVIGAGWLDEDGTISIVLNPCVVLTSESNVTIKLFPSNKPWGGGPSAPASGEDPPF